MKSAQTKTTRAFYHLPRLRVGDARVDYAGGELAAFAFSAFEKVDPDWALEEYFVATAPAVWTVSYSAKATNEPQSGRTADIMLLYSALLAETGRAYPDPRLSVTYEQCGGAVRRLVGAYDRTFLLNGAGLPALDSATLTSVARLATEWRSTGLDYRSPLLRPLRAISGYATAFLGPAAALTPMVAALEGYLLRGRVRGIAKHMAIAARQRLGDVTPFSIEQTMREAYALRSQVLHGKLTNMNVASDIVGRIQWIVGRLVTADIANRRAD